jgi:hypothetical protein
MADNVVANAGSGGATFRTDDDGTAHWPYTKLAWGADNTQTVVDSGAGAIPIQDGGNTITVDGTVNVGTVTTVTAVTTISNAVAVTDNSGSLTVDAPAGTPVFVRLSDGAAAVDTLPVSLASVPSHAVTNAGTFAVQAAQSGTWNVTVNAAIAAGDNNIGNVDIASAIPAGTNVIGDVGIAPRTSGGLSIFRSIDLDESEEEVKASAGQVYSMWVTNTATSTRFIKFYNATAANVTVGTTTPVITIGIPGNTSDDVSGHFGGPLGIAFGTAITVAATTGVADNDTGAPGANEVVVNIFYA